jgi:uncharacterized protein DUF5335
MINRKLDKKEWNPLLDFLSKHLLQGQKAEIEVASLDLGVQIEAEWLPLIGLVYDPKDDIVEVALEGVDHIIRHPREIYFAEDAGRFISLDIVDDKGAHQIVKLRDPFMLPAPKAASSV